ncbi:hypothetical protein JHK82_021462 [Glycine max]|uniref:Uncharacterized protein n=2 Tax=Glycine subgen. Soja TaxID=1462606 RepID=A0A0R0IQW6_SOYBN|nr:hypothetical protein JHK87_021379 [Glycine soja]KAG5025562.1 hypothetical protein JHK86_021476 [Glycine max]KAG5136731.1 hypothetical protein JHK82_021462 [Glycine max]RZB97057.1 hypothetical protein D0Y65_020648 [Glycine soja]
MVANTIKHPIQLQWNPNVLGTLVTHHYILSRGTSWKYIWAQICLTSQPYNSSLCIYISYVLIWRMHIFMDSWTHYPFRMMGIR